MMASSSVRYALVVCAIAITLAGCSSSAQSGFAPSGVTPTALTMQAAHARPSMLYRPWPLAPIPIKGSLPLASPPVAGHMDSSAQFRQAHDNGQTPYYLVRLGTLGGNFSQAESINNRGWVSGSAFLPGSKIEHASLWIAKRITDLGTLGGPESNSVWRNKGNKGETAGTAQAATKDPLKENWCGYRNGYICLGYRWRNGVMSALPTLGGNNGSASSVNNRGEITGVAENSTHDPTCVAPQVLDTEAVIWHPDGSIQELPPLAGDTLGYAFEISDSGQVVGTSGFCAHPNFGVNAVHAVLWEAGSTIDLGSLGGSVFNAAIAINKRSQIVGISGLPGNATYHAVLWQKGMMTDLGTLPGDYSSFGSGINDKGQVVGSSCDQRGTCRAFLWQNGTMTDLNLLIAPHPGLDLTDGYDINDGGLIVGQAHDAEKHRFPGFVLLPSNRSEPRVEGASISKIILPISGREQLQQHRGFAGFWAVPAK